MTLGDSAQDGQRDGVLAAQGQGYTVVSQNPVVKLSYDLYALEQVKGIDRHVADIGDLQAVEGGGPGRHIVRAQHARLIANLPWPQARSRAVRGADIHGNADEGNIQTLGGVLRWQSHHGGGATEPRHLVATHRLVEIAHVLSLLKPLRGIVIESAE